MRKLVHVSLLSLAGTVVFSAGWALGQRAAPAGDLAVDQKLLATIDLAKAIEGMPARELRLSRVRVAPHGHIGLHGHQDDPTVVYVVSGALINHHDDGTNTEVRAGQAFAEFGPGQHWVENANSQPATFVFASVSRP